MSRRNPTHTIFNDSHSEGPVNSRARQARAEALTKLIPLRTAKQTFRSVGALAKAIHMCPNKVAYWRDHYPSCAHIIRKLVPPK